MSSTKFQDTCHLARRSSIPLSPSYPYNLLAFTSNYHSLVKKEWAITWRLIKHNLTFAFIAPFFFLFGQFLSSPSSISAPIILKTAMYFFFYIYCFDIANQTSSVEEDALNKPKRPIPSGLLSVRGAYIRWIISWILILVVGYACTGSQVGLWNAAGWLLNIWVHYGPLKRCHTIVGKNTFTPIGTILMFRMLQYITLGDQAHPRNDIVIYLTPIWFVFTIHLQDIHDIAGDLASGRSTLPIKFPENNCRALRQVTAGLIVALSIVTFFSVHFVSKEGGGGGNILIWIVAEIQLALTFFIAYRVVIGEDKTRDYDDFTYRYVYGMLFWALTVFTGMIL